MLKSYSFQDVANSYSSEESVRLMIEEGWFMKSKNSGRIYHGFDGKIYTDCGWEVISDYPVDGEFEKVMQLDHSGKCYCQLLHEAQINAKNASTTFEYSEALTPLTICQGIEISQELFSDLIVNQLYILREPEDNICKRMAVESGQITNLILRLHRMYTDIRLVTKPSQIPAYGLKALIDIYNIRYRTSEFTYHEYWFKKGKTDEFNKMYTTGNMDFLDAHIGMEFTNHNVTDTIEKKQRTLLILHDTVLEPGDDALLQTFYTVCPENVDVLAIYRHDKPHTVSMFDEYFVCLSSDNDASNYLQRALAGLLPANIRDVTSTDKCFTHLCTLKSY